MGALGVCPLSGKECLGENLCAPALFNAERENKARPEEMLQINPVCPIVRVVQALQVASYSLAPFGEMQSMEHEKHEETQAQTPEERVLASLTLDQDGH